MCKPGLVSCGQGSRSCHGIRLFIAKNAYIAGYSAEVNNFLSCRQIKQLILGTTRLIGCMDCISDMELHESVKTVKDGAK